MLAIKFEDFIRELVKLALACICIPVGDLSQESLEKHFEAKDIWQDYFRVNVHNLSEKEIGVIGEGEGSLYIELLEVILKYNYEQCFRDCNEEFSNKIKAIGAKYGYVEEIEVERARLELDYLFNLPCVEVDIEVEDIEALFLDKLLNQIERGEIDWEEANEWLDLLVEDIEGMRQYLV